MPAAPGVYWFRDAAGQWLYVGKSKCLRARVATYFHSSGSVRERGLHFEALAQRVDTIDYLVTRSEVEALALEANLIREQQPPYNALLKDDKRYPYVCVTWSETYPRILVTRRRRREVGGPLGHDRLYGPFMDAKRLQVVLSAVKRAFPLRQRPVPVHTDRPCLNYDIGLCPGVCQRLITPEAYRQVVQRAEWVFQGRYGELAQHLEEQMVQAALHEEFERAARLRDAHRVLCAPADAPTADATAEASSSPPPSSSRPHLEAHALQRVVLEDSRVSCDAVAAALSADGALASVHLLQVRSGLIVNRLVFRTGVSSVRLAQHQPPGASSTTMSPSDWREASIAQDVLESYYARAESAAEIPDEVVSLHALPRADLLAAYLTQRRDGHGVSVSAPSRGARHQITVLARDNAQLDVQQAAAEGAHTAAALEQLQTLLQLPRRPHRIECFDVSHTGGAETVAARAVLIDGLPAPQAYRRYRLRTPAATPGHPDDVACMYEVLQRRFRPRDVDAEAPPDWPDVVLIDGGRPQLQAALAALALLQVPVGGVAGVGIAAIAKKLEELYVPGRALPLVIGDARGADAPALRLLRRARDEAHRFAITFHRYRRGRAALQSALDGIRGLGAARRQRLLQQFQSVEGVAAATCEQLANVSGIGADLAERIHRALHQR